MRILNKATIASGILFFMLSTDASASSCYRHIYNYTNQTFTITNQPQTSPPHSNAYVNNLKNGPWTITPAPTTPPNTPAKFDLTYTHEGGVAMGDFVISGSNVGGPGNNLVVLNYLGGCPEIDQPTSDILHVNTLADGDICFGTLSQCQID